MLDRCRFCAISLTFVSTVFVSAQWAHGFLIHLDYILGDFDIFTPLFFVLATAFIMETWNVQSLDINYFNISLELLIYWRTIYISYNTSK